MPTCALASGCGGQAEAREASLANRLRKTGLAPRDKGTTRVAQGHPNVNVTTHAIASAGWRTCHSKQTGNTIVAVS